MGQSWKWCDNRELRFRKTTVASLFVYNINKIYSVALAITLWMIQVDRRTNRSICKMSQKKPTQFDDLILAGVRNGMKTRTHKKYLKIHSTQTHCIDPKQQQEWKKQTKREKNTKIVKNKQTTELNLYNKNRKKNIRIFAEEVFFSPSQRSLFCLFFIEHTNTLHCVPRLIYCVVYVTSRYKEWILVAPYM